MEEECIECGEERTEQNAILDLRRAERQTTRGIATMFAGSWMCSQNHLVRYDGAQDALFAASPEVIYTRMYLEIILDVA